MITLFLQSFLIWKSHIANKCITYSRLTMSLCVSPQAFMMFSIIALHCSPALHTIITWLSDAFPMTVAEYAFIQDVVFWSTFEASKHWGVGWDDEETMADAISITTAINFIFEFTGWSFVRIGHEDEIIGNKTARDLVNNLSRRASIFYQPCFIVTRTCVFLYYPTCVWKRAVDLCMSVVVWGFHPTDSPRDSC